MAILALPAHLLHVRYVGARVPDVANPDDLATGANCQLFAYQLLRHYDKHVPAFRSSELWDDDATTTRVETFEPLDLMLYNATPQAWGAHVGVYLGDDHVVHLPKEIGQPAIWNHADFARQPRYACFIGAKRVR